MYSEIREKLVRACIRVDEIASFNPSPEKDKVIVELQKELLSALRAAMTMERENKDAHLGKDKAL